METTEIILKAHDLRKSFKGFKAVDGASFAVRRGSIHGLIGPNGAGKTTCFNLLTGFLRPDSGDVTFEGVSITGVSPESLAKMGMVRSFQISSVFTEMTALENVRIALLAKERGYWCFWRSENDLDRLNGRAMELLAQVGLDTMANLTTKLLPYGKKRALELATTLALEPALMLLDEPTQGMGHEDVADIVNLVRQAAVGRTVLMVEHNMNVVSGLCDTITVMTRGKVLAEGTYEQLSVNPAVREAYLGTPEGVDHGQ
jgi:branched-chain amino acid transport system ATP-binding protein